MPDFKKKKRTTWTFSRKGARTARKAFLPRSLAEQSIAVRLETPITVEGTNSNSLYVYLGTSNTIVSTGSGYINFQKILELSPSFQALKDRFDEIKLDSLVLHMCNISGGTTHFLTEGYVYGSIIYWSLNQDRQGNQIIWDPLSDDNAFVTPYGGSVPGVMKKKTWKFQPRNSSTNPTYTFGRFCPMQGIEAATTGIGGQISFIEHPMAQKFSRSKTMILMAGIFVVNCYFKRQRD